jgi:hypothetical protein
VLPHLHLKCGIIGDEVLMFILQVLPLNHMASLSKGTADCTSTATIASFQRGPEHNDPPLESDPQRPKQQRQL